MRRRLLRKGAEPERLAAVLDDLARRGLLDDRRFASLYARQRARKGIARRRLVAELLRRGVDRALAEAAVAGLESDQEEIRAADLAQRRARLGKSPQQIFRYLLSRGFDRAKARRALEKVFQQQV